MTIAKLLLWAENELKDIAGDDAHREAELLLAHTLGQNREWILARESDAVTDKQRIAEFKSAVDRRRHHEPLPHITGEAWFHGLPFFVSNHVLIPRPETELCVAHALAAVHRLPQTVQPIIVDVGTGSGAIIISLARALRERSATMYATDISPEAIRMAQKNADRNGVARKIHFVEGNLIEPVARILQDNATPKIIIANLPYLPDHVLVNAPVLAHEPRIALAGGDDGLDVLRALLIEMERVSAPWTLILEIDPLVMDVLQTALHDHFPTITPEIIRDLHRAERVVVVRKGSTA